MPLLLRLGQYTLREPWGPRSLCRADRSIESSRRIHRVVWKIPIQLMPAILMEDAAYRIDASGATESTAATTSSSLGGPWGPIGLVGPIGAVESNGVSTGLYYFNTTGLEGLSVLSATAIDAVVALSTVDSDRSVGLVGRSGSCRRIGSLLK